MIRLAHQGASSGVSAQRIWDSQASNSATSRQLALGKAPITPALQAATTRSGPETRNIGAAITGSVSRRLMARMETSGRLAGASGTLLSARPVAGIRDVPCLRQCGRPGRLGNLAPPP